MTKGAFKKAFDQLDTSDQVEVLSELASRVAGVLSSWDEADRIVFRARRHEERSASPVSDVKRRLIGRRSR